MLYRNIGDDSVWAKAQLSQPTKAQLAAKAAAKAAEAVNARSRNLASGKPKSAQEILASFRNNWKDKVAEPEEPEDAKKPDPNPDQVKDKPEEAKSKKRDSKARDSSESSESSERKKRQRRDPPPPLTALVKLPSCARAMATAGLLAKLSEIQEQQTTSSSHIQLLRDQHREWQRSVDELLADIRSQAEGVLVSAPVVQEAPEKQKDTDPASNEDNEDGNDEPNRASISFTRRSMSTESLLRSRNTVAQNFPAGPLRKLVTEVLNDSKAAPKELSWLGRLRAKAALIVQSSWFEFGAGVIILLNLVTIGIEAQLSLHSGETYNGNFWPGGVERIFLAIYSIEALLRLVAGGFMIFLDLWFLLDVALVIVGLLALLIVPAVAGNSGDIDGFERLLVVRGLRLFRLVRAWRMLRHFKIVWRLIYGLMNAGQTIISTTMLIMVSLFIFACVAVEVIAKDEYLARAEATAEIVEKQFFGLNRAMVTLMQFVTLDNLSDVYYPLIMTRPWLCLYFFPILVFISIGLMNLVTAALVENAMQTAALEAEEERLKLKKRVRGALPSLIEIFHALDTDRSGLLTHEEVVNVPLDVLPPRVLDAIYVESMADIFDYLDVDGTGQLSQMEFVEGLLNLCLMDMPISTIQSLKLLQLIRGLLGKVDKEVTSLKAHVQAIGQTGHVELV
ncbi:Voltage-dependent T-type calcium channel subunit alpha-1H [Symbiodinium microadriaticum]|uniref:Voltage-dependent T-type calcium channel subunit alpha-1H n=1 Tax=Symbiodinium microadriaticum TaxID=2951 RepID=A0A1Q9CWG4_SYMMI|nr:Voltage-dependent T-type calcium channel subunit alpha-1H [Symbiodinium microadriaticum]